MNRMNSYIFGKSILASLHDIFTNLSNKIYLYFSEAAIVARGCSTKDKVFYRECETHSYGANLEKMCFCSFDNCNPATTMLLKYAAKVSNWYNISCLVIIIISGLLLSNYQCSSLSVFPISTISQVNLDYIGWNPWPSDKCRCRPPNQARKNIIICFREQPYLLQPNERNSSLKILHCPKKLFMRHYSYFKKAMLCVQASSVVSCVVYLMYETLHAIIRYVVAAIVSIIKTIVPRYEPCCCLLVIKTQTFPFVKFQNLLIFYRPGLYNIMHIK